MPARRRTLVLVIGAALVLGLLYGVVPQLPELRGTLRRLGDGNAGWLTAALAFEILSFAGYVTVFHSVFSEDSPRIAWRMSYQLTMAGVVATRLLATGGAGGIALTAWALSHAGLDRTEVRRRMAVFLALLYGLFMITLAAAAAGLRAGLLPGPQPFGLTVIPAIFAGTVLAAALTLAIVPDDLERRCRGRLAGDGRAARGARAAATVPATISAGVRGALALVRSRRPGLLGAGAWWACDVAVLWACLRAFDAAPPVAVVVVAYFVGTLGNLLPLPGGIGGVEGGMVGALLGFGVASGPAILGVLAYRAFSFWLPILPGLVSYVGLVRAVHAWDETVVGSPPVADRPPLAGMRDP